MKVLKMKVGETAHINGKIFITVLSIGKNKIRLGFSSDRETTIAMLKGYLGNNDERSEN